MSAGVLVMVGAEGRVPQHPSASEPSPESGAVAAERSTLSSGSAAMEGIPSSMLVIVGGIASQAALITALLDYFGWVRTNSFLTYFGVDPSMAGYERTDYILQSIRVALPALIYLAFAILVLFGMHRLIVMPVLARAFTTRSAGVGIRWFLTAVGIAGIAPAAVVLAAVALPRKIGIPLGLGLALPLMLLATVILLGYAAYLRSRYPAVLVSSRAGHAAPVSRAYTLILLAIGLVAILCGVSLYLLLPVGWRHERDRIFLLHDDGSIRLDITSGT